MKKGYIIGLVLVSVLVAIFITTLDGASMYVTLGGAQKLHEKGDDREIHVVGSLIKNTDGSIKGLHYDPLVDPNKSEFLIQDDN